MWLHRCPVFNYIVRINRKSNKNQFCFFRTWMVGALWPSSCSESSASRAIDKRLNCCVCGLVAPAGMNRLILGSTSAAHATALNDHSPALCRLYNEVCKPFCSQFQRLTLNCVNSVVSYTAAIFTLRKLLTSEQNGHSRDGTLFYSDCCSLGTSHRRSKWNFCYTLAIMGHQQHAGCHCDLLCCPENPPFCSVLCSCKKFVKTWKY